MHSYKSTRSKTYVCTFPTCLRTKKLAMALKAAMVVMDIVVVMDIKTVMVIVIFLAIKTVIYLLGIVLGI